MTDREFLAACARWLLDQEERAVRAWLAQEAGANEPDSEGVTRFTVEKGG